MKTTHIILAAVLAATSAVQAAPAEHKLPAPMPEFMSQEQLTKWQADRIAKAQARKSVETAAKQANSATSAFYTGKPFLSETGAYAFQFRNYDPVLTRWTSADPSGFPDGPNNRVYVNNLVMVSVDPKGMDIIHVNDPIFAAGLGHSGAIIGDATNGYTYHSYGGGFLGSSGVSYDTANGETFSTLNGALNYATGKCNYTQYEGWNSTPEEDTAARAAFAKSAGEDYNGTTRNCADAVKAALDAAGISYDGKTSLSATQFFNLNKPPLGGADFFEIVRE